MSFASVGLTSTGFDQRSDATGTLQLGGGSDANQPTANAESSQDNVGTGRWNGSGTIISSTGTVENNDYLVVGTWAGGNWVRSNGETVTVGPTAFAAGIPTPSNALASFNGVRASYSLLNATPVYATSGGPGVLLSTSALTADFSAAFIDINLDVAMSPLVSYKLRGGVQAAGGQFFNGRLAVSGSGCQGANAYCDFGNVQGGFSGGHGQHAVISFGAVSNENGAFGGAASFGRTGQTAIPSNSTQQNLTTILSSGNPSSLPNIYAAGGSGQPAFYGEKLTAVSSPDSSTFNYGASTGNFGAIGKLSDPDFIGWGFWASAGQTQAAPSPPPAPSPSPTPSPSPSPSPSPTVTLEAVHYVVGRPTPVVQMPTAGIANYALIGATLPTATQTINNNLQSTTGRLVSASLTADFGMGKTKVDISTLFGSVPVNIQQTTSINGASFGDGQTVSGVFSGVHAGRAALVYSQIDSTLGKVGGALAFQQTNLSAP